MFFIKKIIHILNYIILLLILSILKLLGKKKASILASSFFCIVGPFTKYHSRAKQNIKFIWPKIKNNNVNSILDKMWSNIGRNFGEFVFLKDCNPLIDKDIKIYGKSIFNIIVEKNKRKKKGIIFFSAHYGNWELAPIVLGCLGLDTMTIYRKSNNKYINNFIQSIRERHASYTPKGDLGAKQSFLWLRRGKSLALAVDQKLNEGKLVKLLGKEALTAPAIAELAIRMNLDIVPIKVFRKEDLNEITFFQKLESPKKNINHEKKVTFLLEQINNTITQWVREQPDQWLWIHRRWKKSLYEK